MAYSPCTCKESDTTERLTRNKNENLRSTKTSVLLGWVMLASPAALLGFPESSVGKESTCNAGDPSSIPGSGRSAGAGIGCPPQYSWASLVAQLVKNLPAMRGTWVRSLGRGDSLGKGKATHSRVLAWRIHGLCSPQGHREFHGLYSPRGHRELAALSRVHLASAHAYSSGTSSSHP